MGENLQPSVGKPRAVPQDLQDFPRCAGFILYILENPVNPVNQPVYPVK